MDDDGPITLQHIKTITGISRNHISEILGYSPSAVSRWENDRDLVPPDAEPLVSDLVMDFLAATDALDHDQLTWDDVIPIRIAAMKLGVSSATFQALMRRRSRPLWDFGTMGLWATPADVDACRYP